MDIYYHLLTGWGFIQAGGYSGWDFWQHAPVGRAHLYPPLFHLILAFLIKIGFKEIILAKIFETITPILFLLAVWHFVRRNFSERLAFFVLVAASSSFSFYMSLINHIPATLAIVFGFLALNQLLQRNFLRSALLLALCFYIHIGVTWLFSFSIIFYGLLNREYRKLCLSVFVSAIILSLPILFKQWTAIKSISHIGLSLHERFFCQFKLIEYILALFGLITVLKRGKSYLLFLSLFFASFILLFYPYRFFSAEGYLPVILLSAVALDNLYTSRINKGSYLRFGIPLLIFFIAVISPTLLREKPSGQDNLRYRLLFGHTAFMGMLFPAAGNMEFSKTIWLPDEYLSTAAVIQENSRRDDIIYSTIDIVGVCLASISRRATSNALLPEIEAARRFDPLLASKIIVAAKDDNPVWLDNIVNNYKLTKVSENKLFIIFNNPLCRAKVKVEKATVPFWAVGIIGLAFTLLFLQAKKSIF
jgi:hypothetical protein